MHTEDGRIATRKITAWESIPLIPHLPCFSQLQSKDVLWIPGCHVRWAVIWGVPQAFRGAGQGVGVGRGAGVKGMAGIQPWQRVKGSEPCSEQLRSPGLQGAKWFVCLFTRICGAV